MENPTNIDETVEETSRDGKEASLRSRVSALEVWNKILRYTIKNLSKELIELKTKLLKD